jgi:hypothetical protein
MNWNNVENNCRALYQFQFINGKDPLERKILIKLIADEFPDFPRVRITYAVDKCIASLPERMSPNSFLTFVKGYL